MDEFSIAVPDIYVLPGESHLAREPVTFRSVLGSCVGVTFLVPRLGIGAICHPMLPKLPTKQAGEFSLAHSRRYVDFTIVDLAKQLDALGVVRSEVQVKIFGGGDVLLVTNEAARPTVGQLNIEAALRVLSEEGLGVVASSLGGTSGVNIQFHTGTGEVLLRRLHYLK